MLRLCKAQMVLNEQIYKTLQSLAHGCMNKHPHSESAMNSAWSLYRNINYLTPQRIGNYRLFSDFILNN